MTGELLSGPERRRRWSSEEKAGIVAEVMLPGATVTEVARRHGISRGLLYTWRREAGHRSASDGVASSQPDLVPVVIAGANETLKRSAVATEQLRNSNAYAAPRDIAVPSYRSSLDEGAMTSGMAGH